MKYAKGSPERAEVEATYCAEARRVVGASNQIDDLLAAIDERDAEIAEKDETITALLAHARAIWAALGGTPEEAKGKGLSEAVLGKVREKDAEIARLREIVEEKCKSPKGRTQ